MTAACAVVVVEAAEGDTTGIVVAVIVAGVLIYWLAGMRKMARWNNDPRSQKLNGFGLYSGAVGGGLDIVLRAMTQLSKSAKIS